MLYLKSALYISLAALLAACSSDTATDLEVPAGHARLQLKLAAAPMDRAGRATWNDPLATDGEMIHSAYVIMVQTAESDGTPVENKIKGILHANPANEFESEVVMQITDQTGTYDFYTFANLPFTSNAGSSISCNGLTFTLGEALPEGLADATYPAEFNNFNLAASLTGDTPGLPMTNKETYTVDRNRTIVLHAIRMVSKMQFSLTNATGHAVRVKQVVLDSITPDATAGAASPMYWLPRKDASDAVLTERPADKAKAARFTYYDAGTADGTEIAADAAASLPVAYLNESLSAHPTGSFPLTLVTAQPTGVDEQWREVTRHALVGLSAIPRNSFVTVPVTLTDYRLSLGADFYPPIGGYPSYDLTEHDDEFYATFSGAGDFVLTPQLFRLGATDAADTPIALNDPSQVTSVSLAVTDASRIFSSVPHIDTTTGEILGTLNGTAGTASATLTLNLNIGTDVTQVYSRTIYIVAQ